MTDPEKFLSRWARRKRAAATSLEAEMDAAIAASATRSPADAESPAAQEPVTDVQPIIDLSALPAIESITAATDIRPFLAPGVPAELTRAALRRAWAIDPQVRDFVGIAENQWDFTDPSGVPGFGPIGSPDDVRRMVTALIGGDRNMPAKSTIATEAHPSDATATSAAPAPPDQLAATAGATSETAVEPPHDFTAASTDDRVAVQKEDESTPAETAPIRRGHGGALPR